MDALVTTDTDARRQLRDFCHDAQQPISTIAALLACLRSEKSSREVARQLDQIAQQLAELADMADRVLLDEARPRWLDLGRELADVLDGFRLLHRGRVDLTVEQGVLVHGDALALRRVLRNLLDNARHACPDGPVTVHLRRTGDRCEIGIADRGSPRAGSGVGIGLGIVGRLAEQTGARVTVDQSAYGSVVTLTMRCARRLPQSRSA